MSLKGKVIVVTGASTGLGRSLAIEFASRKAKLVIAARDKEALGGVGDEIKVMGCECLEIEADVTRERDVQALLDKAVAKFKRVDVWVNNAGIYYQGPIDEIDGAKMEAIFRVNTFGVIYGSKHALIQMKKQAGGHIINIISTRGKAGKGGESVYSASKMAVTGFSQALKEEAFRSKIKVASVFPGGMKTELFRGYNRENDVKGFMDPAVVAKAVADAVETDSAMNPDELVLTRF